MADFSRLIEHAFPLKETSLDSVHEKNVRHGHISTLHIWPARRPLAACRAALIATLLPDPGDAEKRKELCEKIAGKIVKKIEKKKMPNGQIVERVKEETEGGILHWGRETENSETLEWFRQEIRKAYGGRAPKVLDPFAGGGAIPLEAMRLGCEATAVDINPVAWLVERCTLEYPQKLAGQTRTLPEFILHNDTFMNDFFLKAKGYGKAEAKAAVKRVHALLKKKVKWNQKPGQKDFAFQQEAGHDESELQADLAWQVRAWGHWVLDRARRELAKYYPTYADFEPITRNQIAYEHQPMRLVPLRDDGTADIDGLNGEFTDDYLSDKKNPRWIAKSTVAYLWARTVECKNCRATIPMLKTRWLSKKANKRVLLSMEPNESRTGVVFRVDANVPAQGGNAAQRREHDKRIGAGTMSRAGTHCPCCGTIMTGEDIRTETQSGRAADCLTAVVVDGPNDKEYRLPTERELSCARDAKAHLSEAFADLPLGDLDEPVPKGASRKGGGSAFTLYLYGATRWADVFNGRARHALASLVKAIRDFAGLTSFDDRDWHEAILGYLACAVDRQTDYISVICTWDPNGEYVTHTFQRFALPIKWDFCETNPLSTSTGNFLGGIDWIVRYIAHATASSVGVPKPYVRCGSAILQQPTKYDVVFTDPPYYDAIPYSDLMDIFYVWLRRMFHGLGFEASEVFHSALGPKWDKNKCDGELIDDSARFDGDTKQSKQAYEDGMAKAFGAANAALNAGGRMVVVFAHKQPDAWETLVSAIIRAGFIVDGSWPIQTEMGNRSRAQTSAALASSVWMVCKMRPATAKPGWDNIVLEEMRANISVKLREFWDAGIRGPDFVWAATGPAMEAYSKHPVVRKANEPNATMGVGEFLNHVRRMVVDYIVGQVLSGEQGADMADADRLDEVSAYYLLHRHDFGLEEAPVGACILYATACGLLDTDLDKTWDVLIHAGGDSTSVDDYGQGEDEDADESDEGDEKGSGSKVKLKAWNNRRGKNMGYEAPDGKEIPLIDRIHRVMHLWKDGDVQKVDEYLDKHALRRNELFKRVVQSLIELSSDNERSLLESISNHIGAKGAVRDRGPTLPFGEDA